MRRETAWSLGALYRAEYACFDAIAEPLREAMDYDDDPIVRVRAAWVVESLEFLGVEDLIIGLSDHDSTSDQCSLLDRTAAGMARGDFFASPNPSVALQRPGRLWHGGKVAFEQYWLRRWI